MNKRCKKIFLCFLILLIILSFPINAFAESSNENLNYVNTLEDLYNQLEPDIQNALDELGLHKIDYQDILKVSPKSFFETLFNLCTFHFSDVAKHLFLLLGCMIITGIFQIIFQNTNTTQQIIFIFNSLFSILCLIEPILNMITSAFSALQLASAFLFSYVPIYAGLLVAHGKFLASATYNGFMIFFSNIFGVCSQKIFFPFTESMLLLNIATGIEEKSVFEGLAKFLKKCFTYSLVIFSTLFSGLLIVKGNLALVGDGVAIRGVKMVVGTGVPIVGSALSDACSSLLGSFTLIHKALGAFGIIVISLLFVPSFLELSFWGFILQFLGFMADALDQPNIKKIMDNLASTVSFVNTLIIFMFFVFSISTGILFQYKS